MQKYIVSIFILTLFSSCSTVSTVNQVTQNDINFREGMLGETSWKETLIFKRTSWFHEAKMINDLLITKIDQSSPFFKWLGNSQDQVNENCSQFFVAISYSNDFRRVSRGRLTKSITDRGLVEMMIPNFHDNIRAHAAFSALSLENHKLAGFCVKSKSAPVENISVQIPGFKVANIL